MPPKPNEKRREQLLDQLQSLILKEGFCHLRVGTLADRLHCSRSTLYKLAPSKDDLISLVFERYTDAAIAEGEREAGKLRGAADRIMRFSDVIDSRQMEGSVQFWRDVRDTPHVAEVLAEKRNRGYLVVRRFLDEGVGSGEFRPANTAFIAHIIWMAARETRDPDLMVRLGLDRSQASHELSRLIVYGMQGGDAR
ncbi:MAG TPA: TetR/AcrR family transcriptional regulator [Coriobacteriia bacterium]|nr:TetR/AcrR family transcriptional regulator [Coriobacteriia bacterium]